MAHNEGDLSNKATEVLEDFLCKIQEVKTLPDLYKLKADFIGKDGVLSPLLEQISSMPLEMRRLSGARINKVKSIILENVEQHKERIEAELVQKKLGDGLARDLSLPGRGYNGIVGRIHPISKVIYDVETILYGMGFIRADGPEIESSWYNFDALNIGKDHPARQMQDTFYLTKNDLLLRTHTSNVQVRYMEKNKPPLRVYSIGKVYRSDYDATHTPMFHQLELLAVDKDISVANLKWCLNTFLKLFFELDEADDQSSIVRMRPSFFPFTEPSYEVDIRCDRSSRNGIHVGKGNDWIEIIGSGMVNRAVLRNVGIDDDEYKGLACGVGIERLAMLKYNIPDLRSFYSNDVSWLSNFGFTSLSE